MPLRKSCLAPGPSSSRLPLPVIPSTPHPSAHREIMGCKQSGMEKEEEEKKSAGSKKSSVFSDNNFNFLFVVFPNGDKTMCDRKMTGRETDVASTAPS